MTGQLNGNAVDLSWTPPGDVDGFPVGRGVLESGAWRYRAAAILGPGARSYVDQPTAAGEYTYVVMAYQFTDDAHRISDPSNNFDASIGQ